MRRFTVSKGTSLSRQAALVRAAVRSARPGGGAVSALFLSGTGATSFRMRGMRSFGTARADFAVGTLSNRLAEIEACRDAFRSNPLVRRIIRAEVENVIGSGFRVAPKSKDRAWNKLVAEYLESRTGDDWFAYPNMPGWSEVGMAQLACYHQCREGGVVVYRSARGVQLFEAAQIRTPATRIADPLCRDGYQFNADGTFAGLWVGPYDPNAGYINEGSMDFLPAFIDDTTFGRLKVTSYIRAASFASSYHSSPPLVPALDDLERFGDWYDAIVERACQEANVVGVFSSDRKDARSSFTVGRKDVTTTDDTISDAYQMPATIEPGMVVKTRTGEQFDIKSITSPGASFDPFVKQNTRLVAAPVSMPIEIALLHFSDTNFSASKAAIEQFRIACRMQKKLYAQQYSVPNYRMMVYEGMRDGEIPAVDDWHRCSVTPSGWRSLQDGEEAKAAKERMQMGLTSHEQEMGEMFGTSPEDVLDAYLDLEEMIQQKAAERGMDPKELRRAMFWYQEEATLQAEAAKAKQAQQQPQRGNP